MNRRRISITIPIFRVGHPRPAGLPQEVRAWRTWLDDPETLAALRRRP